jgi:hypothetical protein
LPGIRNMIRTYKTLFSERLAFLIVLPAAVAILGTLRYFLPTFFPTLDTGYAYQIFALTLEELRSTAQLPMWVPESNYGMTADTFLLVFGPSQYLFLLLGVLLKASALNLFLASLALDQFIFLFGIALISWRLFAPARSIIIYCVVACASVSILDNQMGFNFKVFEALPLIFYLVMIGIERARAFYFLCGAALLVAFTFGNVTYAVPFQFYGLALFAVILWLTSGRRYERIAATLRGAAEPINVVPIAGTICLIGILFFVVHRIEAEMAYSNLSRAADLTVGLDEYLSYGGYTGINKLSEFVTGQTVHLRSEFLGFFGVTGLAVLLYAAIVERSGRFLSLFAALLFVVLFTVRETGLAQIVYYLPEMDKFRHIAYMLSSAKWLAIVCAGFGFLRIAQPKSSSSDVIAFLTAVAIVTAAFLLAEYASIRAVQGGPLLAVATHLRSAVFVLLTLGVGLCVLLIPMKHSRLLLLGVAILELILYWSFLPFPTRVDPSVRINFANAATRTYQPERIWAEESTPAVDFQNLTGQKFEHDLENAFLSVDLCGGAAGNLLARSILITNSVQALMLAENLFDQFSEETSAQSISRLLPTFGCHAPKLRLVHNPIVVADEADATMDIALRKRLDLYQTPIIVSSEEAAQSSNGEDLSGSEAVKVSEFHANRIKIQVTNPYPDGAWLIYADSYHPAWAALVDGHMQQIAKANLAFKAVLIPPGTHDVTFSFSRGAADYLFVFLGVVLVCLVTFICMITALVEIRGNEHDFRNA